MKLTGIIISIIGFGVIIAGRVVHFHSTEGEALVYGWKYWCVGIALFFVGSLFVGHAK